jgi:hypothetical protein
MQGPDYAAMNQQAQEQLQERLQNAERTATSSLQLANETIHMLVYLSRLIFLPLVLGIGTYKNTVGCRNLFLLFVSIASIC